MNEEQPTMTTTQSKTPLWLGLGIIVLLIIVGGGYALMRNDTEDADIDANESFLLDDSEDAAMMEDEDATMKDDDAMMLEPGDAMPGEEGAGTTKEDVMADQSADATTKTVELTGQNFEFSQKEISVNQGDTVRIVFSSVGGTHDWVVDEFEAATDRVNTGETAEVTFVADKAGTFEYYCSVGQHRQLGMAGTLIVN
jgi:plastocyanin